MGGGGGLGQQQEVDDCASVGEVKQTRAWLA